VEMTVKYLNFY